MGDTDSKALVTRSNALAGEQVMMREAPTRSGAGGPRDHDRRARETGSAVFRLLDGVLR
jgi:hypothetical protein